MVTKGPRSAGSSSRASASRRNRWGVLVLAVLMGGGFVGAQSTGAVAATTGCGSLPSGPSVYIGPDGACLVPSPSKPYTTFVDGDKVDLAMGANSVFSLHDSLAGDIEAIECEYKNASGRPGDPPNADFCDAQTTPGDFPYSVQPGGSFDYVVDNRGDHVEIFALPDKPLPSSTIRCDDKHPCVWYVGEDYNHFTAPHVFSNPFLVGAKASSGGSGSSSSLVIVVVVIVVVGGVAYTLFMMRRRRRPAGTRPR